MMTKQEERNILKQIENLIAAAGEDSYIGMAFAGCCDMARSNIDNDFANNPQEAIKNLRKNLEEAQEMNRRLEQDNTLLTGANKRYCDEIGELTRAAKAEKAKQIPADLYKRLWLMVDRQIDKAEQNITTHAEILADFCDCPGDIAVVEGLKQLNIEILRRDDAKQLLEALEKYEPENI